MATPEEAYVTDIWQAYIERHGHERLCSNVEFCLIRWWREKGIPKFVVLRAIAETGKTGRNLLYLEAPVEREYDRWRKGMTV